MRRPRGAGLAGLYWAGDSPLHRAPVGGKLLVLLVASTAIVWVRGTPLAVAVLAGALATMAVLRVPRGLIWRNARPILLFALLIAVVQLALWRVEEGVVAVTRMLAIAALAILFTLTTSSGDIVAWVERWAGRLGMRPSRSFRIGLAAGLATRSIEHLGVVARQVLEARQARGLQRSPRAFAVPMVVAAGRFAHGLGDALEARGVSARFDESPESYRMLRSIEREGPGRARGVWRPDGGELGPAGALPLTVPSTLTLESMAQCAGMLLHVHPASQSRHRWALAGIDGMEAVPAQWGSEIHVRCEVVQHSGRAARVRASAEVDGSAICTALLLMVPFAPTTRPPGDV